MKVSNPNELKALIEANKNDKGQILLNPTFAMAVRWENSVRQTPEGEVKLSTPIFGEDATSPFLVMTNVLHVIAGCNAEGDYEKLCFNVGSKNSPLWKVVEGEIHDAVEGEESKSPVFYLTEGWMNVHTPKAPVEGMGI